MKRRDFSFELALLGLASAVPGLARAQNPDPVVPADWPEIAVLDGGRLDPASWRGQPAIVVFWATYCAYCKRHNAHVDKLYRATRGQPLRVLGVALDNDEDAVRRYMAVNGYVFPVAMDGGRLRQRLTPRRVIPMTCVLDRQGRLLQAIPGEMSEDDVLGLAQRLRRPAA
jgi:thiol-disulfide isomerase/thioredoxin